MRRGVGRWWWLGQERPLFLYRRVRCGSSLEALETLMCPAYPHRATLKSTGVCEKRYKTLDFVTKSLRAIRRGMPSAYMSLTGMVGTTGTVAVWRLVHDQR